jgi:CDP-glucose 4,6-dehydratase
LGGYLTLVDAQLQKNIQGEWNFGPLENSQKTVTQVIELFGQHWGRQPRIEIEDPEHEESRLLTLNSSKARINLDWKEKFGIEETLQWTADWYRHLNPERITQIQVEKFLEL